MRKSSRVATLLLAGCATIGVTACDDPTETVDLYGTVTDCSAILPISECKEAYADALQQHVATAPQFPTKEACEIEFGTEGCTTVQTRAMESDTGTGTGTGVDDGRSFTDLFIPALTGFMIGRMLSGSNAMPVYVDRTGYMRSGNTGLGYAPAQPNCPPGQTCPQQGTSSSSWNFHYHGGRTTAAVPAAALASPPERATPSSLAASKTATGRMSGGFGSTGRAASGSSGG